ncbi:hypothetical protein DM02DRAFT_668739 [Periconia macrospinosa]|uniref:Cora-domain-containing protein n=1 Tax=Periconia macrospinosa TaxID=97972 RepID=A0A2V1E378_9PLEO|nr:hypothetical protein DM02DRAFT_668739 [Periconia macrospinosa]
MEDYCYDGAKHYSQGSRMEKHYHKPNTYRDYVETLSSRNPCLLNLQSFLSSSSVYRRTCQFTALDFREGIERPIPRQVPDIDLVPGQLNGIQGTNSKESVTSEGYHKHPLQGRILIIEDLTPEVIELVGSTLDVDPLMFSLHLHTTQRNDGRSQTPDDATLPSRLVTQNYMTTTYHRPIVSEQKFPVGGKFERDMAINRKVVFIRSTPIGLAQHSVSVIKVQYSSDFWIALLLVDPPINNNLYPSGQKDKSGPRTEILLRPYLGSHEDFLDAPKFSSDWAELDDCPPRGGMATEIVQYWKRTVPPCFDPTNPTLESLAYYPLRIVAAEWVKYVAVMQHCIKMYEYRGDQLPNLDQFNMDLRELQGWRRRSMVSQQKVRSVIRQLKARYTVEEKTQTDIDFLIEDFGVISVNIKNAGKRLENMLPVVTSLVQIIDARQSFAETTNISRLTILALVFVPLTFVSSLFSMKDDISPGASGFWVYFAVAVPITAVVYLVARPPTKVVAKGRKWLNIDKERPTLISRGVSMGQTRGKPITEA